MYKYQATRKLLTSQVALCSIGKRVKKNQYLPCYIIPLLSLILDYCKREKGERVKFTLG
nr:MAG TPA: Neurotransmitter-gated ion-channel transmembrane region [Caudoviricetes sp.]